MIPALALALGAALAAPDPAPAGRPEAPPSGGEEALPAVLPWEPFVSGGPWVGTFHGLELRGATLRGGVRFAPSRLRLTADASFPVSGEFGLEVASGRTPNGLQVGDTVGFAGLVAGERPLRAILGVEGGPIWLERATRARMSGIVAVGLRAGILLELPLRRLGLRASAELGVRMTTGDYVRGMLLVGLSR